MISKRQVVFLVKSLWSACKHFIGILYSLMQMSVFYILLSGVLVHISTNLLYRYIGERWYWIGLAYGLFIYTLSMWLFVDNKYVTWKSKLLAAVIAELALNNLLDELFFNPNKWEWSEIVMGIIIVITFMYKLFTRNGRSRN